MDSGEHVTNDVLAERIKSLRERVEKIENSMADKSAVAEVKKAISFVQWGVGAAVLTSLMKLLGLG